MGNVSSRRVAGALGALAVAGALCVAAAPVTARDQGQPPAQAPPQGQQPPPGQTSPGQTSPGTPPPGMPPQGQGQPPGGGGPPNGEPRWMPEKLTNLKVLPKDTTPEQIMRIMRHYTQSLGAGCLMCHKGQMGQPLSTYDFADDSKDNKTVARAMIKMTADINAKYPEAFPEATPGEPSVTCATCHRRNRHPEKEPPPPPPRPDGTGGPQRPPA